MNKPVSLDELVSTREAAVRGDGVFLMHGFTKAATWDAKARTARFVMSSESPDRMRDIVRQDGMNIERFMKNPQALLFHKSSSWPIGSWTDIEKILRGRPKRTEGTIRLLPEGADPDADRAAVHIEHDTLRACSIGFIPTKVARIMDEDERWTGGFDFVESELVECSLVPVPANPDALVRSAGDDRAMAIALIEEVLDDWAKDDAGLIVPRAVYEARRKELGAPDVTVSAPEIPEADRERLKSLGWLNPASKTEREIGALSLKVDLDTGPLEDQLTRAQTLIERFTSLFSRAAKQPISAVFPDIGQPPTLVKDGDEAMIEGEWPQRFIVTYDLLETCAYEGTQILKRNGDEIVFDLANSRAATEIIFDSAIDKAVVVEVREIVAKADPVDDVEDADDVNRLEPISGSMARATARLIELEAALAAKTVP